jgi:hypothetical protein
VTVKQVESVHPYDFVHPHCESQIVRWILEQRISADVDFMEKDVRQERRKPERLPVRNEVDLVTACRESDAELRRDSSRTTICRITGDADLQANFLGLTG